MRRVNPFNVFLSALIVGLLLLGSCKKDVESPIVTPPRPANPEKVWMQQVYQEMGEIYFWNDALPTTFDTARYATAEDALTYLISLKINPTTGRPIDRYSFLDKIGSVSDEIGQGIVGDYGFSVRYVSTNAGSYPYVVYAYRNSPAGKAGIARGLRVLKVNSSDVALDGSDSGGAGYSNLVNALYNSSTCNFTFAKADGTTFTSSLATASYVMNSVLLDTVYTQGTSKVGYLVFNQFLGAPAMKELRAAFSKFSSSGITDLIVDLRYNGGGSVATCDTLSSMIAPAAASKKVMNYMMLNKVLTSYYSQKYGSDFNVTYFNKEGTIELKRVFFLVSGSTASASELLINNLKPYMDVFLIGKTTYGKPCGFWSTPIGYDPDQTTPKKGYDLYAVSFESQNARKEGGYYTGMTVNQVVADGVTYALGNTNEDRLAAALYYIANGNYKASLKADINQKELGIDRQFNGMVDFRRKRPFDIK